MLIKVLLEAPVSAVVLSLAGILAVPHPKEHSGIRSLGTKRYLYLCFMWFMNSLHLHIVVALKEVGDLAFAKFGITELAGGGSTAQNKLSALL